MNSFLSRFQRKDHLHEAQRRLTQVAETGTSGEVSADWLQQILDRRTLPLVVKSFDDGFRLPPHMVFALQKSYPKRGPGLWTLDAFEDDATFSNERFMFMAQAFKETSFELPPELYAQAVRMYHQGRLHPDYARVLADALMEEPDVEVQAELIVHDAYFAVKTPYYGDASGWLSSLMVSKIPARAAMRVAKTSDEVRAIVTARVEELRAEKFLTAWLPSAISAEEYVVSEKYPLSVLQNLYASVWDEGYLEYYTRKASSGS